MEKKTFDSPYFASPKHSPYQIPTKDNNDKKQGESLKQNSRKLRPA